MYNSGFVSLTAKFCTSLWQLQLRDTVKQSCCFQSSIQYTVPFRSFCSQNANSHSGSQYDIHRPKQYAANTTYLCLF